MDLEEVQVAAYLKNHPDFVQEWLANHADRGLLEVVQKQWDGKDEEALKKALELSSLNTKEDEDDDDILHTEPSPSVVPRTGRKSVTSDLFHQWLASGSSSGIGAAAGRLRGSMSPEEDGKNCKSHPCCF